MSGGWWVGREEQQSDEPDYEEADADPPDECPMGGEHEVEEIRAATARLPLRRYCVKCKLDFPLE